MENSLIILESLVYFLSIYIILKNLYTHSNKNSILFTILVHIVFFIASAYIRTSIYIVLFILTITIDIISLNIIFKNKLRTIIGIFLLIYSINILLSSIIIFLLNQSSNTPLKDFIGLFINLIVLFVCIILVKVEAFNIKSAIKMIPFGIKRITIISVFSSAFLINLILDFNSLKNITEWNNFTRITIVLLIAVIGSVFPVLIANSIGKSFYNKQAKLFEEQIEIQAKHYEEQAKSNFELRRFKHDYNNMLIGVKKLIEDGNTDAATSLLEKENKFISGGGSECVFDTGNGIVDAILTEKQLKAQATNSVISFEGAVPCEKISPTDLCVIFGNTIDNAIEACEKLKNNAQKLISVKAKSAGGFDFVNISNPVDFGVDINSNNIKTSKKDKLNHGFGLYSLKKAIKKYNGSVSFNCDNNIFSVDLELNIPA